MSGGPIMAKRGLMMGIVAWRGIVMMRHQQGGVRGEEAGSRVTEAPG
jgi:hypothetical protein